MHCKTCHELNRRVRITRPDELEGVIRHAARAVAEGRLVITAGDLQRADTMECRLRCTSCRRLFELSCETYHGSGGEWKSMQPPPSDT